MRYLIDKTGNSMHIFSISLLFLFTSVLYRSYGFAQVSEAAVDTNSTLADTTIIKVDTDLQGTQVYINDDLIGITPLIYEIPEKEEYHLSLVPRNINFMPVDTTIVVIDKIDTVRIQIDFNKAWITLQSNIDSSEMIMESHYSNMGKTEHERIIEFTPVIKKEIFPRGYNLTVQKSGYYSQSFFKIIKPRTYNNFDIELEPLSKKKALLLSALYPGLGQWYSEKPTKALLMNIIALGSISTSLITNNTISDYNDEYESLQSKYRNSTSEAEINSAYKKMKDKYNELEKMQTIRNIFIGLSVSVYIASIIDAYFNWPFDNVHLQANLNSAENTNLSFVYDF